MAKTREQILELERSLAYYHAYRTVADYFETVPFKIDVYEVADLEGDNAAIVTESIDYLKWRGLVEYSADGTQVTVLDEDEPISPNESEACR